MWKELDDYVCASEDRLHYNTDEYGYGWYLETPMVPASLILVKKETTNTEDNE